MCACGQSADPLSLLIQQMALAARVGINCTTGHATLRPSSIVSQTRWRNASLLSFLPTSHSLYQIFPLNAIEAPREHASKEGMQIQTPLCILTHWPLASTTLIKPLECEKVPAAPSHHTPVTAADCWISTIHLLSSSLSFFLLRPLLVSLLSTYTLHRYRYSLGNHNSVC